MSPEEARIIRPTARTTAAGDELLDGRTDLLRFGRVGARMTTGSCSICSDSGAMSWRILQLEDDLARMELLAGGRGRRRCCQTQRGLGGVTCRFVVARKDLADSSVSPPCLVVSNWRRKRRRA